MALAAGGCEPVLDGTWATATRDRCVRSGFCVRLVAVAFPPIKAAHQLLYAEAELHHVQGTLGGPVATYPVAVRNDERSLVDVPGRLRGHRAVWNTDRTRYVLSFKGLLRPRVDDGDILASFKRWLDGSVFTNPRV